MVIAIPSLDRLERLAVPEVQVFLQSDLPAVAADIIQLADNTNYLIKATVSIGSGVQIRYGAGTRMTGSADNVTTLTGDTDAKPFIIENGVDPAKAEHVGFLQDGTGDLIEIDHSSNAASIFIRCSFNNKPLRCITAAAIILDLVDFSNGATLIQDGTGTLAQYLMKEVLFLDFIGADPGFLIESGATVATINSQGTIFVGIAANSIGMKIEGGAIVSSLFHLAPLFQPINSTAVGLSVENPDDVVVGSISEAAFVGAGKILDCRPVSSSTLTSPVAGSTTGVTQDGLGNILIADVSTTPGTINQMTGILAPSQGSINAPGNDPIALAWHAGNMYSLDGATFTVSEHTGFSTTITATVLLPSTSPTGMAFAGEDMISMDSGANELYLHDGFSTTVNATFNISAGFTTPEGLAFDGVNALIGDANDNSVSVMRGVSNIVQYKFTTASTGLRDIWQIFDQLTKKVGFAVSDDFANNIRLYDHGVTMDHSAPTWEIMDSVSLVSSSDRGGVQFANDPGITITALTTVNVWVDIAETGIFYGDFSEHEAMVLEDETNGEIRWLGSRDRGRNLAGAVTLDRTSGGSANDIFYQIAVVVDGIVQKDSITVGATPDQSTVLTINTIPISRDLVAGRVVKLQIRNITDDVSPRIQFAKLSIT